MLSDDERARRAALAVLREEAYPVPGVYWLSFADDSGFLGGCMVEAVGPISAVRRAHELGINPGGEVQILGAVPADRLPMEMANRLLTKEELGDEAMPWPE